MPNNSLTQASVRGSPALKKPGGQRQVMPTSGTTSQVAPGAHESRRQTGAGGGGGGGGGGSGGGGGGGGRTVK